MATVTVTFEWPQDANINPLTTEPFTAAQLRGVDAQETSLIAGKLRHSPAAGAAGQNSTLCTISAEIGDAQYMSPCLCEFLCSYIRTRELVCPHDAELHDCMMGKPSARPRTDRSDSWLAGSVRQLAARLSVCQQVAEHHRPLPFMTFCTGLSVCVHAALDYFGFDVQATDITIADDDPGGVGKHIRSASCVNSLACATRAAEYIKVLLVQGLPEKVNCEDAMKYTLTPASSYAFLVAENDYQYTGKYGEAMKTGTLSYIKKPDIDTVTYRIGDAEVGETPVGRLKDVRIANQDLFRSLSGDSGTMECARAMIRSSVLSLGGLTARWSKQHLVVKDAGPGDEADFEHVRYTKADRWVLTVHVEKDATRAIKRLRTAAADDEDSADSD